MIMFSFLPRDNAVVKAKMEKKKIKESINLKKGRLGERDEELSIHGLASH